MAGVFPLQAHHRATIHFFRFCPDHKEPDNDLRHRHTSLPVGQSVGDARHVPGALSLRVDCSVVPFFSVKLYLLEDQPPNYPLRSENARVPPHYLQDSKLSNGRNPEPSASRHHCQCQFGAAEELDALV